MFSNSQNLEESSHNENSFFFSVSKSFLSTIITEITTSTFMFLLISQLKYSKLTLSITAFLPLLFSTFISIIIGLFINYILTNFYSILLSTIFMFCYGLFLITKSFPSETISYHSLFTERIQKELNVLQKNKIDSKLSPFNNEGPFTDRIPLSIVDECINEDSRSELMEPLINKNRNVLMINVPKVDNKGKKENDDKLIKAYVDVYKETNSFFYENWREHLFGIIKTFFICEFGNRTQMFLMAQTLVYNPFGIFVGAILALWVVVVTCVYFGVEICKYLSERTMLMVTGFILVVYSVESVYYLE